MSLMWTQYTNLAHNIVAGALVFSSLTPLLEGEHLDGKWYTAVLLGPTAGSTPIYWWIIKKKIKSLFKTLVFIET